MNTDETAPTLADLPRSTLIAEAVECARAVGEEDGSRPSHWRGKTKDEMVMHIEAARESLAPGYRGWSVRAPVIPSSDDGSARVRAKRNADGDAYMSTFDLDDLNERRAYAFVRQAFLDGYDHGRESPS